MIVVSSCVENGLPYQKRSDARSWLLVRLVRALRLISRCCIGDLMVFLHCDNNTSKVRKNYVVVKKYSIEVRILVKGKYCCAGRNSGGKGVQETMSD
jgi:hypothetical protein